MGMEKAEEYRAFAKECFGRAQKADSDELRRASLEMASYWLEAAMRVECFGADETKPRAA